MTPEYVFRFPGSKQLIDLNRLLQEIDHTVNERVYEDAEWMNQAIVEVFDFRRSKVDKENHTPFRSYGKITPKEAIKKFS